MNLWLFLFMMPDDYTGGFIPPVISITFHIFSTFSLMNLTLSTNIQDFDLSIWFNFSSFTKFYPIYSFSFCSWHSLIQNCSSSSGFRAFCSAWLQDRLLVAHSFDSLHGSYLNRILISTNFYLISSLAHHEVYPVIFSFYQYPCLIFCSISAHPINRPGLSLAQRQAYWNFPTTSTIFGGFRSAFL